MCEATTRAYVRSSISDSAKPIVIVVMRVRPAASAAITLESNPPDNNNPTGTSAIKCWATTSDSVLLKLGFSLSLIAAVVEFRRRRREEALWPNRRPVDHFHRMPGWQLEHAFKRSRLVVEGIAELE